MLAAYLVAVGVLAILVVIPGPDLAVVTRFTLGAGREGGLRATTGVVVGLAAWGVVTVAGLAAVLAASAEAYTVVRIAGALYLVGMGLRMLWRGGAGALPSGPTTKSGNALRAGALTNLFNPKIAVFYATILPTLVPHGGATTVWLGILVATHAALSIAWLAFCALALSASRRFAEPRLRRLLERVTGVVLIGFGARLALFSR